jgi:transposase InsO family protein
MCACGRGALGGLPPQARCWGRSGGPYPYLLGGLKIAREPRRGADVTLHFDGKPLSLVAIIDLAGRAVLALRLSNANNASFCGAALEEALLKPLIFNTNQGSTICAEAFADKFAAAGVAISMDGRGRFMDNIFIERLRRSIKKDKARQDYTVNSTKAWPDHPGRRLSGRSR